MARLTEECGLPCSHFTKAFKYSTGVLPHGQLVRMHVDRTKELTLGNDEPLSQIGVACGFSDQPRSLRIFLQLVGVSPSTWRRIKRQCIDAAF